MKSNYTGLLQKIEAELSKWLPEHTETAWEQAVFPGLAPHLAAGLIQPGRDLFVRGGKRWRPLLMALVCETLGGGEAAIPLTPLVEFTHTASLIHDDIEDNSEMRRGKPAVHLIYGVDTAINSGSFLYFLPLNCISAWDAPAEHKLRVFEMWSQNVQRLHLGQAMDIAWHRDPASIPAPEDYLTMCRLKTGVLARLAAVLGVYTALRGTAAEELEHSLGAAAENLGVGFQILDDVTNLTTGNPGKKRGDDIVEGKKSLPVILFLRQDKDNGKTLARCFSAAKKGVEEEVEELIGVLEQGGFIREANRQGCELISRGKAAFTELLSSACSLPEWIDDFFTLIQ